jgi:hypothetical protein
MAEYATRRLNKLFGRFRERVEKLSESVTSSKLDDEDLIDDVIQRIDMPGDEAAKVTTGGRPSAEDGEERYKKLMKRLEWQLSKSGIRVEEVVRAFPGEIQAVLLYKSYEKFKERESNLLREKFIEMGWKNIQPNLWLLPPDKTPGGPVGTGELKVWLRRKLAKPFGREFDYVFPVVAVIDLKKVAADKKGIRKMPVARTIYDVLEPGEVVPASHLYKVMKLRGFGVRDIILSGNIPFLASAFATPDELLAIQENEETIGNKLRSLTGSQSMGLQDLANLGPDLIAGAFGDTVAHAKDLAQRLIVEAQFWMRQLGGTVPSPGPVSVTAPVPRAAPPQEEAELVQKSEQWGEPEAEAQAEPEGEPLIGEESWLEPGEKPEAEDETKLEAEPNEEAPPNPRAERA